MLRPALPVWSRNHNDYDLALYVANWPAPRSMHWQSLLVARAIENQAYVAGCNRVGTDGNGHHYRGDSRIITPQGEIIATAEPHQATRLDAELSLTSLKSIARSFRPGRTLTPSRSTKASLAGKPWLPFYVSNQRYPANSPQVPTGKRPQRGTRI